MGERVGFIGLGIMGSRMAANLARAGFELTVWNRTAAKAGEWAARHGAAVAASPQALASNSDVVISMVVDGAQVESVLLGDEGAGQGPGLLCIDMSTIGPAAARRVGAGLQERGVSFMDAPVTGSSPKAEDGTLTIMAGGSANSTMLQLKGRPMLEHDFTPLFKLEHMLKDVRLCLDETRTAGSGFPFAALAGELYSIGVGRGLGEQDFAAVLEVVEGMADARL